MNATITFDKLAAQIAANDKLRKTIADLKMRLDAKFKSKIKTPEDVYIIHDLLEQYKTLVGKEYKITFEENTIV